MRIIKKVDECNRFISLILHEGLMINILLVEPYGKLIHVLFKKSGRVFQTDLNYEKADFENNLKNYHAQLYAMAMSMEHKLGR